MTKMFFTPFGFLLVLGFQISQCDPFCGQPSLFYTTRTNISCMKIDSNGRQKGSIRVLRSFEPFRTNQQYISRPFSLDARRKKLFWADIITKTVYEYPSIKEVGTGIQGFMESIALDWISEYIYWTDIFLHRISVLSINGSYQKILIEGTGLQSPTGLAVDPIQGYLFWANRDAGTIERSRLDGSDRLILIRWRSQPLDISLDLENHRLFWVETLSNNMCSSLYKGQDIVCITNPISMSSHTIKSIAYYKTANISYVTDSIEKNVKSYSYSSLTFNKTVTSKIDDKNRFWSMVEIYDSMIQISAVTPCSTSPCSHFCFKIDSLKFKCGCPTGMKLGTDLKSCVKQDPEYHILYTDITIGRIFSLTKFVKSSYHLMKELTYGDSLYKNPVALVYDKENDMLYFTDIGGLQIVKMKLDGSDYKVLKKDVLSDGIAFEPQTRKLLWTDWNRKKVYLSDSEGIEPLAIIKDGLDRPRDLEIYFERGLLILTDWGEKPKIEQWNMDGTDRVNIAGTTTETTVKFPNGLTIDHVEDKLYYTDAHYDVIRSYSFSTKKTAEIVNSETIPSLRHPFGISLYKERLYWTDWIFPGVYSIGKRNGTGFQLLEFWYRKPGGIYTYEKTATNEEKRLYKFVYLPTKCAALCHHLSLSKLIKSECPSGYKFNDFQTTCASCVDQTKYGYRCNCSNWATCHHRIEEVSPCTSASPFLHFGVTECIQTIKPGYCRVLQNNTCGSTARNECVADQDCLKTLKCCKTSCGNRCTEPSYDSPKLHPCQTAFKNCNYCIPLPNFGHKCLCPEGQALDGDNITCTKIGESCRVNNTCMNSVSCMVTENGIKCNCKIGFKGLKCQTNEWCTFQPCKNNGICHLTSQSYRCECNSQFTGKNCTLSRFCNASVCKNHGVCYYDTQREKKCNCSLEYTGHNCETWKTCENSPCLNGGSCFPGTGLSYKCTCAYGYRGRNCETKKFCYPKSPCKNNGNCTEANNGQCICPVQFGGLYCELIKCYQQLCQNNGVCSQKDIYSCNCPVYFIGRYCALSIEIGVMTIELKRQKAVLISILSFRTACANALTLYCKNKKCFSFSQRKKRSTSSSSRVTFVADDVVIIPGFPKLLSNGNQEFQFAVLVPKNATGNEERKVLPMTTVDNAIKGLKYSIENELDAIIVGQEASTASQSYSSKIYLIIGVSAGGLVIILLVVLKVFKSRRRKIPCRNEDSISHSNRSIDMSQYNAGYGRESISTLPSPPPVYFDGRSIPSVHWSSPPQYNDVFHNQSMNTATVTERNEERDFYEEIDVVLNNANFTDQSRPSYEQTTSNQLRPEADGHQYQDLMGTNEDYPYQSNTRRAPSLQSHGQNNINPSRTTDEERMYQPLKDPSRDDCYQHLTKK